MKKLSSARRALSILMSTVLLTSTFTASFVVPNLAHGQTIVLEACNPGMIESRSSQGLFCFNPNNDRGDGDPRPVPSDGERTDGRGGGEGAGGGRRTSEAKRRASCKKCTAESQKCVDQARLGGDTCRTNAERQAVERCDIASRGPTRTVTSWGCSIFDHTAGNCSGVESPWDDRSRWNFGCSARVGAVGADGGQRTCSGVGVDNCIANWRVSHRGGSEEHSVEVGVSAEFAGIGVNPSATITSTSTWNGKLGWLAACEYAQMSVQQACTAQQNRCYDTFDCGQSER